MSKKAWFMLILIGVIVSVLLASKYVAGFDKGANDYVIDPILGFITGITAGVTAHPIWQSYGYPIAFIGGVVFTAAFALILWPKIRTKQPVQAVSDLQDKIKSTPTKIPKAATKPASVPPKTVVVEAEEEPKPEIESTP